MTVLQLVAARLARVDRLVFHAVDARGRRDYDGAEGAYRTLLPRGGRDVPLDALFESIEGMGFTWGVSDGA